MSPQSNSAKARSATQIEAEIAATRSRLSNTVDELAFRVSPAEVTRRQTEALKAKVDHATRDADGNVRMDRVAGGLGGVAALALSLGALRRTFHKS